jgi:hypothetical protein
MGRFALTWSSEASIRAVELDASRAYVIGRAEPADIVLDRPTVSRRQAVLHGQRTTFSLENASSTNPTQVDNSTVSHPAALVDGSTIVAGGVVLRFWDLASGDRISGPVCSHCSRENLASDAECWFCGTSLVNAPTGIRTRREVTCRLVGADGLPLDLVEGQSLSFGEDGIARTGGAAGDPAATLEMRDGQPTVAGAAAILERDGEAVKAGDGRPVATGDLLRIGARAYVVIRR